MDTKTMVLIILAAIVALSIVWFQYYFKAKKKGKTTIILSFLRFIAIFGLLLLLVNPKFTKTSYTLEKPNLVLLVDNSTSVKKSGQNISRIISDIENSEDISDRFNTDVYTFGSDLKPVDSLSFNEKQTDIRKSLRLLEEVYARTQTAIILLSDGNQTIGQDYTFSDAKQNFPVYTFTIGDTTSYKDLSIGPINTNKFAFLNNKYPLETYVSYQGDEAVSSRASILVNNTSVFTETINLSPTKNIKTINALIDANTVGIKSIEVRVNQLPSERNIVNNVRKTVVDVIDEKTNIGLVSEILHPDLGALKKSIESNEQREVSILKPSVSTQTLEEVDLFLLYQPNAAFKNIFDFAERKKSNLFIITGAHTDFRFLNGIQKDIKIESGYPIQEVFANLNNGFSKFDINDFDVTAFPPLDSDAGPLTIKPLSEPLLGTSIKGKDMNIPLLSVWEENSIKKGLLLGEGIWRWRMQSFRNSGDFSNFDEFMGKLLRYLVSSKGKDRLNVDYSSQYEGNNLAIITATYFDETYVFDANARINIIVTNTATKERTNMPMVLRDGYFEADLSNLLSGTYNFTVNVVDENYSESGSFTISDFDVEQQFVSSNYKKMQQLSENTGGVHYFEGQIKNLIQKLSEDDSYVPTQKSSENVVSLIDFRILLAIITLAFASEWFIRKYIGLI